METKTLDKKKLDRYNELFGKDWVRILKTFIASDELSSIGKQLKANQETDGKRVYPLFDNMFRAFSECPYGDLKTVFLTTNTYEQQMDGLAFSCASSESCGDIPKVLTKVFDAVEQDVARGMYLQRNPDLTRWAEQGVLLLNADLSNRKGDKPGSHLALWKPFIEHVMEFLGNYNTGIIYVLIGKEAVKYERFINVENNDVFKLEHPMLAVTEGRPWRHQNIFSRINEISKFLNNTSIDWTGNGDKESHPYGLMKVRKIPSFG